jgi:hypothetical protein
LFGDEHIVAGGHDAEQAVIVAHGNGCVEIDGDRPGVS